MKLLRIHIIASMLLLPQLVWSQGERIAQEYQLFQQISAEGSSLYGSFDYSLRSNALSNELMNEAVFDGVINSASSAYIVDENSSDRMRLQGGVRADLWYRLHRTEGLNLLFGLGMQDLLLANTSMGVAQLYLKGNGPFEDQTLELGPSQLKYMSYQFFGFGIEHQGERSALGVSTQLIKTSRYQDISIESSSLYTAPYGTTIDATLGFDYIASSSKQNKASAWYGTGASINAYWMFRSKENGSFLGIQINDLGFVHFGGTQQMNLQLDTSFSGIEVQNILALDDALATDGELDSIEAFLGVSQKSAAQLSMLPGYVNLYFTQPLGEKVALNLVARQYFTLGRPELRSGMRFKLAPWYSLEPYVRFGGFTRFDYGLTQAFNFGNHFQLMLNYEMLESQLNGKNSTSQALFAGGQILF